MCSVVHKTTSELERVILTTLFLLVQRTPTVGALGRGAFPLDVLMVPSSTLAVTVDSGFSLGKTIHIRSLEFIIDCFSDLSLSPRRDGSDV
jgi:hypothetical protein